MEEKEDRTRKNTTELYYWLLDFKVDEKLEVFKVIWQKRT